MNKEKLVFSFLTNKDALCFNNNAHQSSQIKKYVPTLITATAATGEVWVTAILAIITTGLWQCTVRQHAVSVEVNILLTI